MKKIKIITISTAIFIAIGLIVHYFIFIWPENFYSNPKTLNLSQRENEIQILKTDFEKNKKYYYEIISAVNKENVKKESISAYYDLESKTLFTYAYDKNKPQELKYPTINKAYRDYFEKSDIPFSGISIYFEENSVYIHFDDRLDKNHLYGNLYNPLRLNYEEKVTTEDKKLENIIENIKLDDHWYAYFAPIF